MLQHLRSSVLGKRNKTPFVLMLPYIEVTRQSRRRLLYHEEETRYPLGVNFMNSQSWSERSTEEEHPDAFRVFNSGCLAHVAIHYRQLIHVR